MQPISPISPTSIILSFDLGTAAYSAPELFSDSASVSFPSDVFSLGVTLWQMAACRAPYAGKRTVEVMLGVRRGMFWQIHERDRVARIGGEPEGPLDAGGAAMRRAGSLRAPAKARKSERALLADTARVASRSSEDLAGLGRSIGDLDPHARSRYGDGAPAMYFPAGLDRVDDAIMELLKAMTSLGAQDRPRAEDVCRTLQGLSGAGGQSGYI